jgi:Respiratory-chain NADH dehydrogenase, 30 Kd subunit
MSHRRFGSVRMGQATPRANVPTLPMDEFRRAIMSGVARGLRVSAFFGDTSSAETVDLYAVLADGARSILRVGRTTLESETFPSLTPECPQVHLFEREIAEQYGIIPSDHPWLKPVRFHPSYRSGHEARPRSVIGVTDFYRRGTSAFNVTANRSFTWKSRWVTSIAGPSVRSSAGRTNAPYTLSKRWLAIRRLATSPPIATQWRH